MDVDSIREDNERNEALEYLIKSGILEGVALGIAKMVLAGNENKLTVAQRHVYDEYVLRPYLENKCKLCSESISFHEAVFAFEDNEGYCSLCAHRLRPEPE